MSAVDTKLMTVSEIVEKYGVARKTVQRWISADPPKLVPVMTLPGRTGAHLFDPADAEKAFGNHRSADARIKAEIDTEIEQRVQELIAERVGEPTGEVPEL